MIFNQLAEAKRRYKIHPGFAAAFDFLNRKDIAELPNDTCEIDGKHVYAMVQEHEAVWKRTNVILNALLVPMDDQGIELALYRQGTKNHEK